MGCFSTGTIKGAGMIVIVPLLTTWTLSADAPPAACYEQVSPGEAGLKQAKICFLQLK
jgi:hypothetical protein